jgi:hypothetical protein
MKNPLHYQISEYDCGPTTMLNAVSYLFEREEIPPEVVRNIMLYCLDCYSPEGTPGKKGTSCAAMMFLSNWLNSFGKIGQLPVSCRYLTGENVFLGENSMIDDALHKGGVAVVRLYLDEWHYVLFTNEREGRVFLFDPYYMTEPFKNDDIIITEKKGFQYNRIVPAFYFNRESSDLYALGPYDMREAVLIFNENTRLTEEKTIEYFI